MEEIILKAIEGMNKSYSPYSKFKVGAALLMKDGKYITGCNIENAAYSPGNCAERTAIFKAVSEGYKEFKAIAIIGGRNDVEIQYAFPCGVCRQVMMEFCDPETFSIIVVKSKEDYMVKTLKELLPYGFGNDNLKKG